MQIIAGPIRHPASCPVRCNGPTVNDHDLREQLLPRSIDQCRVGELALAPGEIAAIEQSMLSAMKQSNDLGASRDQIVTQGCSAVRPALRDRMIRNFPKRFSDTRTRCSQLEKGPRCEGVVAVCPPKGTGTTYANDVYKYINQSNMNMPVNTNVLTRTSNPRLPNDSQMRSEERRKHPEQYPDNSIQAGHFPDAVWSGAATPTMGPLPATVNRSIGGQSLAYPVGYRNRMFVPGSWTDLGCTPSASPNGGS